MIPYGRQDISQADIDAVVEVLQSDFLTQGPVVPEFEKIVATYCDSIHAIAVNSATSALHLACLALGVGAKDLVWTSPISFVASANCARYCGADVDFVDIDPLTFNMSVERLAEKLEQADRLPKVVIPVHMAGQSCDMREIHALSLRYGFRIIEDASHAIGGSYKGEKVGGCRFSDIAVFSFHPVKIITTGEGGMALTNDRELAKRMALLRSHGITRHPSEMTLPPDGAWYYQQIELGFNYRMTEIQAALGVTQMQRINEFVLERNKLANKYDELLNMKGFITPWQHPDVYSSRHLYILKTETVDTFSKRKEVFDRMREAGVGVNVHYIPIYRQPYYSAMGFSPEDFPAAENYYANAITLPLFPGLSEKDQEYIVQNLIKPSGYQTLF
jgi:UDP-4-amino-4,6-dideoxy-N-acetyl-beta-L-altrosamine transaminase